MQSGLFLGEGKGIISGRKNRGGGLGGFLGEKHYWALRTFERIFMRREMQDLRQENYMVYD